MGFFVSESITKLIEFYKKEVSRHIPEFRPYKVSEELRKFASLFTPGSFYLYVINFQNLNMDFVSEGTKKILGVDTKDFNINELFTRIHPDDLAMMERKEALVKDFLLNYLEPSQMPLYKVIYFFRVRGKGNEYKKILHQTNVLTVSETDTIEHVLGIHTDVSHLPIMFNDKVSFLGLDHSESYFNLDVNSTVFLEALKNSEKSKDLNEILTKKEKEIIRYLIKGFTGKEIAEILHISFDTVRTHRKNMLSKSNCKNSSELISRCLMEGISL